MDNELVLFVYKCTACGHCGNEHLTGDGHDGEAAKCEICRADVILEWDGGVVLVMGGSAD